MNVTVLLQWTLTNHTSDTIENEINVQKSRIVQQLENVQISDITNYSDAVQSNTKYANIQPNTEYRLLDIPYIYKISSAFLKHSGKLRTWSFSFVSSTYIQTPAKD